MKFNFKKVASVLASAAMLGSTIGMAAAASMYPDPFIKGGVANVAIVVGASAATIDNIAAVDVGANLQAELAKQTATTSSIGATGVGGDSVNLASTSQRLFYGSAMNVARTGISKSEMPTLLADGTIVDDAGTEYSFTQTITPGNNTVAYSTSGGDLEDPALLVQVGTVADAYLYQLDLSFNKNINISSSDVQGNNIKILGKDFTIGSGSNSGTPVLYLYGAGTEKTVSEGETANLEVGGKTYALEVKSVEQTGGVNYVSVSVDGGSIRRITEGSSSKVGDIEIYAKSIHYLAKEAQTSYADLNIGSTKIKFAQGTTVKSGTDETSIQGTKAYLTSTGANGLSKLSIKVAMAKSASDHLGIGTTFEDPIFGGLQVKFADVAPALDSDMRDSVVINTDNNRNAKTTFTPYLGSSEGAKTVYFGYDQDTSESTITTRLADSSNKTLNVLEGALVGDAEYMVVNAGDYGRILKVTELPTGDLETTSKIQLEDALTGKTLFDGGGLTVGTDGNASTNIDGNTYYFSVVNSTTSYLKITWGTNAAEGVAGTQTTLFPRIKLAKGGWLAFLKPTTITYGLTYSLPGLETLADYEAGLTISAQTGAVSNESGSKKYGNVNYSIISGATNNLTGIIGGIDVNGNDAQTLIAGTDCIFNSTSANGAAVLFLEEKKITETNNANNGDAICVNLDVSGSTTPVEVSVSTPVMTGTNSALQSLTTDSNVREAVTRYGTFVEYDSTDNDAITIKYPDEQMYADILVTQTGVEVAAGGSGGSVASLGSIAVMDSEIATVSSKNLIVLGGSCINTVAAKMLGSDSAICGADFTTAAGISSGQFLIKVLDSPYTTGKVAMLVAGYEGADTRKAATYLVSMKPSTIVGTDLKKQTATYEDVV
ncbi:MAG: hypothetical protein V1660_03960 [archaeon]